jgi:hypothetical protein
MSKLNQTVEDFREERGDPPPGKDVGSPEDMTNKMVKSY